jgi:hypothetical protein
LSKVILSHKSPRWTQGVLGLAPKAYMNPHSSSSLPPLGARFNASEDFEPVEE